MFDFGYEGQVAVVTGSSSGLGAEMVRSFAEQGADVALLARRKDRIEAVAEECRKMGVRALPVPCDVMERDQVEAAIKKVGDEFGRIDVLVNDAGIVEYNEIGEHTFDQWSRVIATDLTAVFLTVTAAKPYFVRQKYGRVMNVASVCAIQGSATQYGYDAAKAGVMNLTRSLACDLGPYGVLVNAVAPGLFYTEMTAPVCDTEHCDDLIGNSVIRRFGQPKELMPQVLLFCSRRNTFCTGQTIAIDGGMTSTL
jgi:NAD(P)-dependent dehydrogenase (short-subunit alcohol dehydrogenase family)